MDDLPGTKCILKASMYTSGMYTNNYTSIRTSVCVTTQNILPPCIDSIDDLPNNLSDIMICVNSCHNCNIRDYTCVCYTCVCYITTGKPSDVTTQWGHCEFLPIAQFTKLFFSSYYLDFPPQFRSFCHIIMLNILLVIFQYNFFGLIYIRHLYSALSK